MHNNNYDMSDDTTSDGMIAKFGVFNKTFENPMNLLAVERSLDKIKKLIFDQCAKALQV